MCENDQLLARLRDGFKDRALYLALLYRSFCKALLADQVENLAREAIFEYGRIKGRADGCKITAEEWVSKTPTGASSVFGTEVIREADCCKEVMHTCPLVEAWQEMGCTPEEIRLLCDIAMEVDRGRADYHGLSCELTSRIGQDDESCCLVLRNKR